MADYVLLYSGGRMPESEDEQAQVMKAWEGPVQVNRGRHARSQAMPCLVDTWASPYKRGRRTFANGNRVDDVESWPICSSLEQSRWSRG